MKKITILRIIARLNIGGPAIHTVLLTEGLDKTRFRSLLVHGSLQEGEGDMSYYAREKSINPIFVPQLRRKLSVPADISALIKIYKIIRTEQPDIIHTHTAKAGTLGRAAGILYNFLRLPGRKQARLVHTFHGHVFEGYFDRFQTRIFILIERFLAVFTARIVTVSESIKEELIALGICKPEKIEVIPLGFELDKFLEIPPPNEGALNIGIVGRLVPIKNHRLFLEAAAKVIADNPGTRLSFKVVGDGELRFSLQEYAGRLGISGQVEFLGWQKDLAALYSSLDLVALTSLNEGTPVSLIEAMASSRTVVATDVGGVRDLLGPQRSLTHKPETAFLPLERGIIVKPNDARGFSEALNFALRNGALARDMAVSGREFARNTFSKQRLVKDMEGLYAGLIAQ